VSALSSKIALLARKLSFSLRLRSNHGGGKKKIFLLIKVQGYLNLGKKTTQIPA